MCKFKGDNKVNIGRINVNETGSAQRLNLGAYGADEKCEWEVKLSRMSTAQLKKMTKLMERTGCDNEDAINALEGNDYHLGNAESEIEAYGGAAGLRAIREAGEERKANQLRANQIRIRSTQLVKKASENSSKKSHNTVSISKLSTGSSKPKPKSNVGCAKQNMEGCSRFNQGARVYFQKWTPGVVVARKAGGEYDVSEVEGQCMSASFQCINEGTLVKLTANQLRNRNAIACCSPIRSEKTDRSQKLRRNARGKVRNKTASKKCAAQKEPLDSPSKCVSLSKDKKLEERSALDKASNQPLSQGSMSQQALLLSFCLTTTILIPAIYVVLTQSKKAQMFKYLLLNQLLWSYLFCAIFVLEGNVPLFPIPGIYFSSIMKWFPEKMNIVLPIHLFISVGHTQSYFLACLYKVSYASAFNKLQFWFEDPRKLEAIVGGLLIIFSTIIVGPFLFYNFDVLQLRQVLLDEYPLLHQLIVHEPSVIASPVMTFPRNCTILTVALTAYGLYIPFTFISGFSIYLIFLRQAFLVKDFMNDKTYHNYLVVVHAKSVQICSVFVELLRLGFDHNDYVGGNVSAHTSRWSAHISPIPISFCAAMPGPLHILASRVYE
ncbi:hypothetical protein DdX_15156 [Ditylenchus destructor]|uniref:Uncharacterized protein n=1 Tax=Ditylenchus destructor TaxID=166010 RepID=A0AAD4MVI3_9BILA|nr:hypothetical protein DdX_15156 [Ditylenchus destructor]